MKNYSKLFPKNLIMMIVVSIFVIGCSGSGDDDPNSSSDKYFRFKFNGVQKNYRFGINANDPPSESIIHFVTIGARETNDILSPSLSFQLVSNEGAGIGFYNNNDHELHSTYAIQNVSNGVITSTTTYTTSDTAFQMEITSLSSWGVKGRFSGQLKNSSTNEVIEITDGEFSAPYNGRQ